MIYEFAFGLAIFTAILGTLGAILAIGMALSQREQLYREAYKEFLKHKYQVEDRLKRRRNDTE